MVYPISKLVLVPLLKSIFIKKVKGLQNIPKDCPFVIASNHASGLDSFFISAIVMPAIDKKIHFFALKTFFKWPHRFIFEKWAECIKVNGSIEKAAKMLEKKEPVGIFPEGTRSYDGSMQKAHNGVSVLALKTGLLVVPIGIKGSFDVWPRHKKFPKFKKAVEINIGKPLLFKKTAQKRIDEKSLISDTRKIMKEIARLSGKKYRW